METIQARYEQAICFATVAESGSFTRAASALERSKAHVSKQVSALETALGVQLLMRTTRRLVLTEAGRTYLEYCRQLRDTLLEGEQAVSAVREEVSGTLRMTAPTSFGDAFLLEMLLDFQTRHPKLRIALDLSIVRRDLVGDGYDFAIRTPRNLEDHLIAKALGLVRDVLVASPDFLARQATLATPADLAGVPCLLNTHFRDDADWLLQRDGQSHAVRVDGAFAANHFGMLRSAAIAGVGIARLPRYIVAAALADGRLVPVLPAYEIAPSPVYLVYPQRRHMPYRNRVFRDFVVAWFADPARAALLS
ncbi:LysR family transcriptional regulator [Arenimonas oryziterrae]|uniref:HTH lysR-type domain-containing protein n=1 Tax=Arenimonas oryziterrae DSM 21050 = YC6267 TaxID=1121015 RepID=A0A091BDR0_9GAMM|nr:LysR family transcriptional regulator [Arenimonas oryziterrae]KFN42525.1 hypothetical protein N789_12865 [Arenimonas oryziterrae DSM 21050 = YC6267]